MALISDIAIVFWDGKSAGTEHMIKEMKKAKKICKIVYYNEKDDLDDF